MPVETSHYDPTDFLTSEKRIEAYLEAAWENAGELKDIEKRFAYLADCFELVLLARQRWLLPRLKH